jgi:hypothetical protein
MPVRPVSSYFKASDYYMNYYMRMPRVSSSGSGTAKLALSHPHGKASTTEIGSRQHNWLAAAEQRVGEELMAAAVMATRAAGF